jgi:hypothetical protein
MTPSVIARTACVERLGVVLYLSIAWIVPALTPAIEASCSREIPRL